MVRRFKSRATAGRHFKTGTMIQFTAAGDILSTAFRGDGDPGTLTLPTASDVWHTAPAYGVNGNGSTPTKVASSITNCAAPNVKLGVAIDDVTGTYSGSGTGLDLPTLTITDNGDGTGAVATITGSTVGTTNTVLLAPWFGLFQPKGNRVGDGTIALSLPTGSYWAFVESTLTGSTTYSESVGFRVTDSGAMSPLSLLRATISECPTFQTFAGVNSASLALQRIFYEDLPPPADGDQYSDLELSALRPFALVILPPGGFKLQQAAMGSANEYDESGKCYLWLERTPPTAMQRTEADEDWQETVFAIARELGQRAGLSAATQYLAFDDLTIDEGPGRYNDKTTTGMGESQCVRLEVTWGGRQG